MIDKIIKYIRYLFNILLLPKSIHTARKPLINNFLGYFIDFFYPRFVTYDLQLLPKLSKCPVKPYLVNYLLRASLAPITLSDCDFITMASSDARYQKLHCTFRKKINALANQNFDLLIPELVHVVEVHPMLTTVITKTMTKLLFDLDVDNLEGFFQQEYNSNLWNLIYPSFNPEKKKNIKKLYNQAAGIATHWKEILSEEDGIALFYTTLLASIETNVVTATNLIYFMAEFNVWPTSQDNLIYFVKESLRMVPPVNSIARHYQGCWVSLDIDALHYNTWSQPEIFNPQRWLQQEKGQFKAFGIGRRSCSGAPLAIKFQIELLKKMTKYRWKNINKPVWKKSITRIIDNKYMIAIQDN